MSVSPFRFTIRGFMIAIGVIAGLLALPDLWRAIGLVLLIPCLSVMCALHLHAKGLLGAAGLCFWGLAILTNGAYAALSTSPGIHLLLLVTAWIFLLLPTIAAFGIAWARLIDRSDGTRRLSPTWTWLFVISLTLMPFVTAWTAWPFQLRFLRARPALECLAEQVTANRSVTSPQWAGPFYIAGSAVDPSTGNVGLMIDTRPSGPSGFVLSRRSGGGLYGCFRPFRGDWYHLSLTGGWCYHEED